jgi:sporulation protein YqfC
MKGREAFAEMLKNTANRTGEPILGEPLVEVLGNSRVLIENHRGILEYNQQIIRIRVNFGEIRICGDHIRLANMNRPQLVVCGQISQICLIQRRIR